MSVDWLLTGGEIVSFDPAIPAASALAVTEGRIVAVGSGDELAPLAGPRTRRTRLDGAAVLPGFCDTHMHLEKVSHEFSMLALDGARDVADVCERVRERADGTAPGAWIRCLGDAGGWHERNLAEGRLPTRAELDAAAGGHPVFLYRRPDHGALNSAAATALAGLLADAGDGEWDPATGHLHGTRVRLVNDALYRPGVHEHEHQLDLLACASRRLLEMGVTTVVDPGLPAGFDAAWRLYRAAADRGVLAQRVLLMNRFDWRRDFTEELDRVRQSTALPGDGDGRLRAWALKLVLDGEFTGAWHRPGEEPGSERNARYSPGELRTVLRLCADRAWPLCVHAMGGGAIAAVTAAVRELRAGGAVFTPGQVSIAHAFLIGERDLDDCAELGIGLSVQPALAYTYAREMRAVWGALAGQAVPFGTMARRGARFAGGSDTHPCDPLTGAAIAVTRKAWDGSSLGEHEALTPHQALSLYTREAGHYIGLPDVGVLTPGAVADFAVWPENPLGRAPEDWPSLRPALVAVDGRPVWTDD
ncbi:amidohydrolase [Prauserella flavalba]|uniref:amidohydrolase n=1 Tax=Prauserella flavalba TaxID=1477506 RepID=UPI00143DA987|nr:amidohydrolase family protein [Prauserella flavalba]